MIGVVLAGGRSRRFGADKARAPLGDRSLVERAAELLRPVTGEVVVADRGRRLLPDLPSLPEEGDRGPAGGLLAAAAARPGRSLLALACDLPLVPTALLERLRQGASRFDWVLPVGPGGPEPAVAAWTPPALAALARRVAAGRFALRGLLEEEELAIERIDAEALRGIGDPETMFLNVNRPGDLRRAREHLSRLGR